VGVVLNTSSRQVSERLLRLLPQVVPAEDLFVTHLAADGTLLARRLLERRYDTLFVGGGDRSFAGVVSVLLRQARASGLPMPRLGLLRLKAEGGLCSLVQPAQVRGAGPLDDVLAARAGEVPGWRQVDLLETEGGHALFAGWAPGRSLMTLAQTVAGAGLVECEVRNGGTEAQRLDAQGRPYGAPVAPGALLFRGRAWMAAASCVPEVRRRFAHAGRSPGRMHLRLGMSSGLGRLGALGRLMSEPSGGSSLDVLASQVTLQFSRRLPLAIGGGKVQLQDRLELKVSPSTVELCDFSDAFH